MKVNQLINDLSEKIRNEFAHDAGGHDWWHIKRVWLTARHLAKTENANQLVVELAALLHDIADWKYHQGDELAGGRKAQVILNNYELPDNIVAAVVKIVDAVSFKGADVDDESMSIEGQIVQDADRLDAIGAIGIARTFAFGGSRNRLIYDPQIPPVMHQSFDEYKKSTAPTINHFYEKLLLLKDRMHTNEAKKIARERHQFMEHFLSQFYHEWSDYDDTNTTQQ